VLDSSREAFAGKQKARTNVAADAFNLLMRKDPTSGYLFSGKKSAQSWSGFAAFRNARVRIGLRPPDLFEHS